LFRVARCLYFWWALGQSAQGNKILSSCAVESVGSCRADDDSCGCIEREPGAPAQEKSLWLPSVQRAFKVEGLSLAERIALGSSPSTASPLRCHHAANQTYKTRSSPPATLRGRSLKSSFPNVRQRQVGAFARTVPILVPDHFYYRTCRVPCTLVRASGDSRVIPPSPIILNPVVAGSGSVRSRPPPPPCPRCPPAPWRRRALRSQRQSASRSSCLCGPREGRARRAVRMVNPAAATSAGVLRCSSLPTSRLASSAARTRPRPPCF